MFLHTPYVITKSLNIINVNVTIEEVRAHNERVLMNVNISELVDLLNSQPLARYTEEIVRAEIDKLKSAQPTEVEVLNNDWKIKGEIIQKKSILEGVLDIKRFGCDDFADKEHGFKTTYQSADEALDDLIVFSVEKAERDFYDSQI